MADPSSVPWAFSALFNHRAVAAEAVGRTVFVFPSRGSHWTDMAIDMLHTAPAFADEMQKCERAFSETRDWSLREVVLGDAGPSASGRVDVSQMVSFAVMVSLVAQWRALGIHPDAVLGHSHGEIAAAYVAGGLSLRDAARVITRRSEAVSALAGSGGMVSIPWPAERVQALIEQWGQSISVAAHDGPCSTVVAGAGAAVDQLMAVLARDHVSAVRIPIDYASHSAQIEELRTTLRESLSGLQPRTAEVTFISSVTGAGLDTSILDGDYWFANLRQPVLFEQAVRWSYQHGYPTFIECCPHPVLTAGIQQSLDESAPAC
jgi:polyketide synthase 12